MVAQYLGGTVVARDVRGAPDGTHDCDVRFDDGRRVALEITTAANPVRLSLSREAFGRDTWNTPDLENNWIVSAEADENPHMKTARQQVPALLAAFERHGELRIDIPYDPSFVPTDWAPAVYPDVLSLHRLGFDGATAYAPKDGPVAEIYVTIGSATWANRGGINACVEAEAKANAEKLQSAEADERHIFIWLDSSMDDVELAFSTGELPDDPPTLPDRVDVAWLATAKWRTADELGVKRLARVRPPAGWELLAD